MQNMTIHKTALRLPKELHQQIIDASKKSGISMNAEIVTRLKRSFEQGSSEDEKKRFEKVVIEVLDKMEKEGAISYTK
jgi:predicted HicB family RNase H-like nuclease